MRRFILVVAVVGLLGGGFGRADEIQRIPQSYLDSLGNADGPPPLPRGLAPGETPNVIFRDPDTPDVPPSGPVWTPAEYDYNQGLLISWTDYSDYEPLLTEIAYYVSTLTSGTVWIVVDTVSEQNHATSVLVGAGARLEQVEFIVYDNDSVWIRDYGPRFIREGEHRAIVDHNYNRSSRPRDNAFPDHLAALWGEPQYDIPLTHGGGNFHLFSDSSRDAFMSDLILDENPGLLEQDVVDYYQEYQGLDLTITDPFPTWYDSTQHIDMWLLPVADREVIIGEYPVSDSQAHAVTENAVTVLEGRGYTVHRTPGWKNGAHYTYTNSVVFNEIVLACQFQNANASYADEDAAAVAVFETAFPNRQVVPVDCSDIIDYSGAAHCIVMHVPVAVPEIFADGFENGDTSAWDEGGEG